MLINRSNCLQENERLIRLLFIIKNIYHNAITLIFKKKKKNILVDIPLITLSDSVGIFCDSAGIIL